MHSTERVGGVTDGRRDDVIHVAAAAVFDAAGRVLLSRRHPHSHQGGLWEFPGGKLEPGEDVAGALRRELLEELAIEPLHSRPLIRVHHDYGDRRVLLDVWRVDRYRGTPRGCEGQPIDWFAPDRLDTLAFPGANLPIVQAVRLPDTYAISPPLGVAPARDLVQAVEAALDRGLRLLQLRQPGMPVDRFRALARAVAGLCERHGARLLVNADPVEAGPCGAAGVHLNSRRLMALRNRPPGKDLLVAASCHDPRELAHACALGLDFVVCSPVLPTPSHPGAATLGWTGLRRLTEAASVPVYALGGMVPGDLPEAWRHGAQGIAAMRALLGNGTARSAVDNTDTILHQGGIDA